MSRFEQNTQPNRLPKSNGLSGASGAMVSRDKRTMINEPIQDRISHWRILGVNACAVFAVACVAGCSMFGGSSRCSNGKCGTTGSSQYVMKPGSQQMMVGPGGQQIQTYAPGRQYSGVPANGTQMHGAQQGAMQGGITQGSMQGLPSQGGVAQGSDYANNNGATIPSLNQGGNPPNGNDPSKINDQARNPRTNPQNSTDQNRTASNDSATRDPGARDNRTPSITQARWSESPNDKYTLRVGDLLEILYTQGWPTDKEYTLQVGDEVKVEFLHQRTTPGTQPLDRNLRIQPDGKVSMPYIGMVDAANRTVPTLAAQLNDKYRELYVDPKMHVTLVSSVGTLKEFRESVRAAGSRLVEVGPDGSINLPNAGVIRSFGLKVDELQSELNERYRRSMPGVKVTVRLVSGR